jgi:hypothetical protein
MDLSRIGHDCRSATVREVIFRIRASEKIKNLHATLWKKARHEVLQRAGRGTGEGGWATGVSASLAMIFCGSLRQWKRTLLVAVVEGVRLRTSTYVTVSHPNDNDLL